LARNRAERVRAGFAAQGGTCAQFGGGEKKVSALVKRLNQVINEISHQTDFAGERASVIFLPEGQKRPSFVAWSVVSKTFAQIYPQILLTN
jgi:hypothetical protein